MRTGTRALAVAGVVAAILWVSGCEDRQSELPALPVNPDIILISIDSLRPDHLGCYGYEFPTSPTIDRLAREGVRCANAFSTTSWTLPAHAALFTGLYDSAHGLTDNGLRLSEKHTVMAEILKGQGYQTAGFFGGPYLHPAFGFGQGFETYESCMTTVPDDTDGDRARSGARETNRASHADITGPRTLERFSAWLETADERPLFVFLHLWDVHYDYIPPKRYVDMFDPDYTGEIDATNYIENKAINAVMSSRDLQHIIALYDGEIRSADHILGRILETLDRAGRFEESLVVVTADHGEEFFEHRGKGHNRTLFDEVTRIPLIVRWSDHLPAGHVIDQQVRLIDVMPTVLGLAGVPLPEPVQGQDVSRLLRGQGSSDRAAFSELLLDGRQLRTLRAEGIKVFTAPRVGKTGYFDLGKDPGELRPLGNGNGRFERGRAALDRTLAESLAIHEQRVGVAPSGVEIDEELKERLRSLGYIGGDSSDQDE